MYRSYPRLFPFSLVICVYGGATGVSSSSLSTSTPQLVMHVHHPIHHLCTPNHLEGS